MSEFIPETPKTATDETPQKAPIKPSSVTKPAHIRAALTMTQLSIPVRTGRAALGTWQGIYVFEHRARPHRRSVLLHLIGE